jgi:hypothetical protein
MALAEITKSHKPLARPIELVCFALIVAQAVYLLTSYWQGTWILGHDGKGIASDFVNVWAAGKLVLQGNPALAYDWPTHKAVEEMAVGHGFDGYFGWHYPPVFLFAAAVLALGSYALGYLAWLSLTLPMYVAAVRAIAGEPRGYWLALAFPALLSNLIVGQNGFLTAALFGGALVVLVERPILAGILIGLLTFKPHLGLLIPVALIAGGHRRAFLSAGVTTLALAALSWLAFGSET